MPSRSRGADGPDDPDLKRAGGLGPLALYLGLPEPLREAAARIYWDGFGGKLGKVLGPEPRALRFLTRVMRADHCLVALDRRGTLVGIAGFKSPEGNFAGGTLADMQAVYGRIGALWRAAVLWLLGHDVDNERFLVDGICVARTARGQGVGSALLGALYAEAETRGYAAIRLDVVDTNWRARALYERQGFVAVRSESTGLLRHIFGFSAATTMVRPLSAAG